ncbi:SUMF1/EgtB/PvdO family nonheme iron enzyme [Candidatus Entotheonella palauensis]|uniref:SUMF1/EgtB/PvdO family nonheme iron enzyme n=1 Tax=Candidatus Entotheonella palauensis TaxID=93172 RepID=UPI0034DE0D96
MVPRFVPSGLRSRRAGARSHGPPPSPYKVLRGGAWSSHRGKIRAAYRNYDLLTDRHLEIGFRCVKSIK